MVCDAPAQVFPQPVVLDFPRLVFSAVRFAVGAVLDCESGQGCRRDGGEVVQEVAEGAQAVEGEGRL